MFFAACVNIPAAYSIILGSNPGSEARYSKCILYSFTQFLQAKVRTVSEIVLQPLPTSSMVIVYLQIVLTLAAILS